MDPTRLTFHGEHWRFDDVEVLPKPHQQPHPPTWVAATSPEAITWAAARGYDILMDPHATFAEIGAKYDQYCAGLAGAGHPPPGDTPMARLVAVAATDAEAREIARVGAGWTVGSYIGRDATAQAERDELIESYVDDKIVWGSAGRVRDEIARLRDVMRLDYLMIAPLGHDSFIRFTDDVLPHL